MKSKEELKELKEEYKTVCKKLKELSEDELKQVAGGHIEYGLVYPYPCPKCGGTMMCIHDLELLVMTDIHCIYCGYYNPDEKITPYN